VCVIDIIKICCVNTRELHRTQNLTRERSRSPKNPEPELKRVCWHHFCFSRQGPISTMYISRFCSFEPPKTPLNRDAKVTLNKQLLPSSHQAPYNSFFKKCSGLCSHSQSTWTYALSTSGNASSLICRLSAISCVSLNVISSGITISTSTMILGPL